MITVARPAPESFKDRNCIVNSNKNIYEPLHKKINNLGFRPGPTQTSLYSHSSRLEA